jgi:hypothetical protein
LLGLGGRSVFLRSDQSAFGCCRDNEGLIQVLGGRVIDDEGQLRTIGPQPDDAWGLKPGFGDALAIEERAVGAVQIDDAPGVALFADFQMASGNHGRLADHNVVFRATAHADGPLADQMPGAREKSGLTNQPCVQVRGCHRRKI